MSDYTTTPILGLYKPNYDADEEQWGTHLNLNADTLDAAFSPTTGVFLPLAGGAMGGSVSLAGISTAPLAVPGTSTSQIASTAFVSAAVTGLLTDAPTDGQSYARMSSTWQPVLSLGGGTLAGPLLLAADPTAPLGAATAQYADGAVNRAGGPFLPTAGGTMTGGLNYTATSGTTSRAAQDRAHDVINVLDYGAKLDGTTVDTAAFNAAATAATADQTISIPHGSGATSYTLGGLTGGPATQLRWIFDGVQSGGATAARARPGKGDLVQNFHAGTFMLLNEDAIVDSFGEFRVDYNLRSGAGTGGVIHVPIYVNAQDNAAAVTSMWGVDVAMTSYSNQSPWPQNTGVNSTVIKLGRAWAAGMHITMDDRQNVSSTNGGAVLGMEIGTHSNGADDAFSGSTFGGAGVRAGMHFGFGASNSTGLLPVEFMAGIQFTGDSSAIVKSVIGIGIGTQIYQALDTRGAVVPSGWGGSVAAVRMAAGQVIDFNGGVALNSLGGSYLQYTTAVTPRLLYMSAGTELFSFSDQGVFQVTSSIPTSIRLAAEHFISFTVTDNRTLMFTQIGGNRLSYVANGNESLSLTDTNILTLGYNGANPSLNINGNTSTNKQIRWQSAGLNRWVMGLVNNESTGNAGSNFLLQSYDDTGASLMANVLTITRSSGLATFGGALTVTGAATLSSTLRVNGTVGFNNTAPVAKPNVTGAKGSNAALASLLTALAAYGLVTDSTSA